jgi:hypothetical protein
MIGSSGVFEIRQSLPKARRSGPKRTSSGRRSRASAALKKAGFKMPMPCPELVEGSKDAGSIRVAATKKRSILPAFLVRGAPVTA